MITINNTPVVAGHYPDNAQILKGCKYNNPREFVIFWRYENDEELVTLIYLVHHIRNNFDKNANITLKMPYIPNARMDRTHSIDEVFTLKYFSEVINSLEFDRVFSMDAHSNVSTALINRLNNRSIEDAINNVLKVIVKSKNTPVYIYFPDDGAYKRYHELKCFENCKFIYGKKIRDWDTGDIKGLDIYTEKGEVVNYIDSKSIVLMIDDIVSYGGTLAYSADKLKSAGAGKVYAYATHTENAVLDPDKGTLIKRLNSGKVECLFTTASIFTQTDKTDKIKIIYELDGDNAKYLRELTSTGIIKSNAFHGSSF